MGIVAAQLCSLVSEELMRFTLPLYVPGVSGSSSLYGAVVAMGFVPYVVLTPLCGVVIALSLLLAVVVRRRLVG